jgi:alpha 1,2-mannosyltransferase
MEHYNSIKPKAVIWYIASRPCLKRNLKLLYKNFNNKYKYPVIVFTFREQYSRRFIDEIHKNISSDIKFIKIEPPEIPLHIKEEELFYNRKDIPYVKSSFPKSRLGFLHAGQFVAGEIMNHAEMEEYEYALKLDDDTFIIDKIDFDIFKFMKDNNYLFGPFHIKKYDYETVLQCQIGLRELVKKYIKENNLKPKSKSLDEQGNWDNVGIMHPTVWDLSIFRNRNWKKWWDCVNQSGGIYKYRWGDLGIHALYMRMYYPDSVWHNFDFYNKGICKHGGYGPVYGGVDGKRIYKDFHYLIGRLKFILAKLIKK